MQEVLIDGPIRPEFVAACLERLESATHTGANAFFLGRVRADSVSESEVTGIDYSAYPAMAEKVAAELAEAAAARFGVQAVEIYHSRGLVKVGEVSLLATVSSAHRKAAFEALEWVVDELKVKFPAWKRELLRDGGHRWVGAPGSG